MTECIIKGDKLLASLAKNQPIPDSLKTPESVVNIMWALTKKCDEADKLYISGAMRLDTHPADPVDFEKFINECGKDDHSVYSRISTHMKENILQGEKQRGIDCQGLPAGKRTVLFAKQPDGTIYLKMEEHGCPPFWKKGFRNFKNFSEFVGHSTDFIMTRFDKPQGTVGYAKRKEHVPEEIKKEFNDIINLFFPKSKQSFFDKLMGRKTTNDELRTFYQNEGGKKGISEMSRIVEAFAQSSHITGNEEISTNTDLELINEIQLRTKIYNMNRKLQSPLSNKPDDYKGDIKGNEVPLTLN
jgi:hypothetical protein